MKNWKTIAKRILMPPGWVMLLLSILSVPALVAVFVLGKEEHPLAYCAYMLAFYSLTVVTIFFVREGPGFWKRLREAVYRNPVGKRYMTDPVYRTRVSLNASLGVNLLYVAIQLLSWYLYHSWWFVILGTYYATLAVMRFLLLRYAQRKGIGKSLKGEAKRSRTCAVILLLLNFVLSGAVLMILYEDRGFEYAGLLIYVMASYTFFITTQAIVNIIRYRKYKSPVMSTSKAISLCAALVSMLSLETAMFSQFGADMALADQRLMIILTGAGVSLVVIALSVLMIRQANRLLKQP